MSETNLKIVNEPISLDGAAREYKATMSKIKALEEYLKPFKAVLESAALQSEGLSLDLEEFKVLLVEASREIFDLKTAKIKLGADITNPFTKVTTYTQLRVTEKNKKV